MLTCMLYNVFFVYFSSQQQSLVSSRACFILLFVFLFLPLPKLYGSPQWKLNWFQAEK